MRAGEASAKWGSARWDRQSGIGKVGQGRSPRVWRLPPSEAQRIVPLDFEGNEFVDMKSVVIVTWRGVV